MMRRNRINAQSAETKHTTDTADSFSTRLSSADLDEKKKSITEINFPGLAGENMAQQILLVARRSNTITTETAGEDAPLRLFGILVGTVRRKLGFRLEDAANRANLPVETLAAIELGAATFDEVMENIRPLGDALGNQYKSLSRALVEMTLG